MLRSMYSGISGMKGFQTKLDVVGNNIANVNTTGFKKGRVNFQDMMSQTMQGASAPTNNRGGINPKQVGVGSQIGAIDTLHTQGFLQTTNRNLDVMIEGDGMFAVDTGTETLYTRVGNFYLSRPEGGGNAELVTSDGYRVLGSNGAIIEIPDNVKSINVESNGDITYVDNAGNQQVAGTIGLAVIPNPEGLEKVGESLYRNTSNTGYDGDELIAPESDNAGKLISGALEMSNVDLSEEFTEMIIAQRGFQANTRIITTSDEVLQELVNLKR